MRCRFLFGAAGIIENKLHGEKMDDFEQPGTAKLGDEVDLRPDNVTPTEELLSQIKTPVVTPQISAQEPLLTQNKTKKKVGLVVSVVVLVLALVGGVAWFVLADNTSQNGTDGNTIGETSDNQRREEKKPTDEPEPKDEVVELSVNDELVQKLYQYFKHHIGYLTYGFYSEDGGLSGNIDERLMTALAFSNMDLPTIFLYKTEHDLGCYDARPVRDMINKIFGKQIDFYDGMGLLPGDYPLYVYSAVDDAFCLKGGFGSIVGVHHNLYKAEKDSTHIYLYVIGGRVDTRGAEIESDYYGTVRPIDFNDTNEFLYHPTGNDETDILEYANELGHFKWTFVWNGENYIFEKLERI